MNGIPAPVATPSPSPVPASSRILQQGSTGSIRQVKLPTPKRLQHAVRQAYDENYDCSHSGAPPTVWVLREYPSYAGTPTAADQHCCAAACVSLIESIQITKTVNLVDSCCIACNRHSCNEEGTPGTDQMKSLSEVEVPSLLNGLAAVAKLDYSSVIP